MLANAVDPAQMAHYVASDLDLHCLPMTLLWVSRFEVSNLLRDGGKDKWIAFRGSNSTMSIQSTLVISTSVISNDRLSRRENLIPVLT